MIIELHNIGNKKIAKLTSDGLIINSIEDGIDLLGSLYYEGYDKVIIYEKNLNPKFFDLKTKMAGEILQKFTQYKVQLSIVGEFSKYNSSSLDDFIRESNKGHHIHFVDSIDQALPP